MTMKGQSGIDFMNPILGWLSNYLTARKHGTGAKRRYSYPNNLCYLPLGVEWKQSECQPVRVPTQSLGS